MTAELRPASTVLVLRDSLGGPEVFMVRRHDQATFMAGAHVFPGGAVDAADFDPGLHRCCDGVEHAVRQLAGLPREEALAFHVAAIRELFEEAGVLLARDASGGSRDPGDQAARARMDQWRRDIHSGAVTLNDVLRRDPVRLALDALTLCAHWVTPRANSRRFDTRFFAARLPEGQRGAHDERETTDSLWIGPGQAIAAATRGEILLPPPTWVVLRELEAFQTVDEALAAMRARRVERIEPESVEEDGGRVIIMPDYSQRPSSGSEAGAGTTRFVWRDGRWRPL